MTSGQASTLEEGVVMRSFRSVVGVLLANILLAVPTVAETVRVRSGDHASFSRLVLPLPQPASWSLGRSANGYILEIDREGVEFDLTEAFDRIARTRIADLRAEPELSRLAIDLGCDCHATAFVYGAAAIVIDVNDGPPPPGSRFENPVDEAAASPSEQMPPISLPAYESGAFRFGPVSGLQGLAGINPDPASKPSPPTQPMVVVQPRQPVWAPADPAITAAHALPGSSESGAMDGDRAAALAARAVDSERLLRELSRATAQGLLQPSLQTIDPFESLRQSEPPPEPAAGPEDLRGPELAEPQEQESPPNLRIVAQTSIDRDTGVSRIVRSLGNDAQPCLDDSAFDITSWGDTDVPEEGIRGLARHRENLVQEFDRPDPKRVIELVRYYIWLGFGVEARSVLEAFAGDIPAAPVEAAIAALVDGEVGTEASVLKGQAGCSGRAALWSLLVEPDGTLPDGANRLAVVAAFSELPPNLRSVVGQDLARRFLAAGDRDSAIAIRNALARAGASRAREAELIDARLAVLDGDSSAGRMLADLAVGNDRIAAEALALQVEAGLDRGETVAGAADAIAGLARTHGDALPGTDLDRLSLRARIAAGDYDEVRADLLRRSAAKESMEQDRPLWSEFIATLTADAADATFLRHAFALRGLLVTLPIDAEARRDFGRRLEDLGFEEEAREALSEAVESEAIGAPEAVRESLMDARMPVDDRDSREVPAQAAVDPNAVREAVRDPEANGDLAPGRPNPGTEGLVNAQVALTPAGASPQETGSAFSGAGQGQSGPESTRPPVPSAPDGTARPVVSQGGTVQRAAEALENARAARAAIEQRLQALRAVEPSG